MQNSTYDPKSKYEFNKEKLRVNNQGISGTCIAGQTLNLDYTLTDDHLLLGLKIGCKGQLFGDHLSLQVLMGETVIETFTSNWKCTDDVQRQVDTEAIFPAKIPAGLTIRVIFTSTGESDVQVFANLILHKVLV